MYCLQTFLKISTQDYREMKKEEQGENSSVVPWLDGNIVMSNKIMLNDLVKVLISTLIHDMPAYYFYGVSFLSKLCHTLLGSSRFHGPV